MGRHPHSTGGPGVQEGETVTALYDGFLGVRKTEILPCCRQMDVSAIRRNIYVTAAGRIAIRQADDPKKGIPIAVCPFCGARAPEGKP